MCVRWADYICSFIAGILIITLTLVCILFCPILRFYRRRKQAGKKGSPPNSLLIIGYVPIAEARSKGILQENYDKWYNPGSCFKRVTVVIVSGREKKNEFLTGSILYRECPPFSFFSQLGFRFTARILGLIPATALVIRHSLSLDVAQINGPNISAVSGLLMKMMTGIPSVVFIEAFWEDILKYQKNLPSLLIRLMPYWYRIIYRCFDGYVGGPSLYPDRYIALGVSRKKIFTYISDIDINEIIEYSNKGSLFEGLLDKERPWFVTVGRLHPEKLSTDALSAFEHHVESGGKGSFIFIGDGPLNVELKQRAEQLGGKVIFTGALQFPDMAATVKACDVFVATYQGNALIEAMALGVPVVAYDNPPHRGLVFGEDTVLFSPDRQPEKLGEKFSKIAGEKDSCPFRQRF